MLFINVLVLYNTVLQFNGESLVVHQLRVGALASHLTARVAVEMKAEKSVFLLGATAYFSFDDITC
jgi:hypothetical protein